MGHRANFVIIRDGSAKAYYDQWAALGSTYGFIDGPDVATTEAERYTEEDTLMDWAFAEAGYLIDYDQKTAIVFGYPEPMESFDDMPESDASNASQPTTDIAHAVELALEDPLQFLLAIAKNWQGWRLIWDDRGVDAFALHLASRDITSIETVSPSHPPDTVGPIVMEPE